MFKKIAIIGDGAMASVLAILLCEKNLNVTMWGYDADQLNQIEADRENKKFLAGYKLPASLVFNSADDGIFDCADLVVSAVPCQFMRSVWNRLKPYYPDNIPVVSVAKGIEIDTLKSPNEIIKSVLSNDVFVAALSGPTIADELARKLPATACVACKNEDLSVSIQQTFTSPWFRIYTNTDIVGVELAGAMKNVIAIAAGIVDGIGAGDNAKAALLSRGLAEISRLGLALGAKPQTFAGLTGMGDLVTTCISPKGRNRSFGERIGKGMTTALALEATNSVVEGVSTCKAVFSLAKKMKVEMPITCAVYMVLFENKPVTDAITELMTRQLKAE
jgi:glycerol-3-phosphate dehydrogenase (NAD(P)+)